MLFPTDFDSLLLSLLLLLSVLLELFYQVFIYLSYYSSLLLIHCYVLIRWLLCSMLDDEFWLLDNHILFITSVVILYFVNFWLHLCVLLSFMIVADRFFVDGNYCFVQVDRNIAVIVPFLSDLWFVSCKRK